MQQIDSTQKSTRIDGLDVARALAICGMTLIHLSLVLSGEVADEDGGWFINRLAGRPAIMFMLLAGIGVALRCQNASDESALLRLKLDLRKRGLFFFVFGYVFLIVWSADILRVYGLAFLLSSLLLTRSNRALWLIATSAAATLVTLLFVVDFETNWDFSTFEYSNLWTPTGAMMHLFYNGTRAVFPWAGLLLIGMIVGRCDLRSTATRWKLFSIGLITWLATEFVSHQLVDRAMRNSGEENRDTIIAVVGTDSFPSMPLFLLSAGGLAVAVIVVCIYLAEVSPRKLWLPLADMGRMSFTWYIGHIGFFYLAATYVGPAADRPVADAYLATAACCGLMIGLSHAYRKKRTLGPLEWLLRRLTS